MHCVKSLRNPVSISTAIPAVGQRYTGCSGRARYDLDVLSAETILMVSQFVEDEGDVVFYKNAYGVATTRPVFADHSANDSGVELDK